MLRLTKLRKERKWTKTKLGAEAGLHPSTVGKIEGGRMIPYPGQLAKLAAAFGLKRGERLMDEVTS